MKEVIEKKLEENIERILAKTELLPSDVAILKEELTRIEFEENKEENDKKQKELLEIFSKTIGD